MDDAAASSPAPRHRTGPDSDAATPPPGLAQTATAEDEQSPPRPDPGDTNEHRGSVSDSDDGDEATPADTPPPFWCTSPSTRPLSYQSITQVRHSSGPIQLEDHSADSHVQAQSCWASSATVDSHVVVSGATGIGAYVVWHCTVQTLKGGDLDIRKRYSEFDALRTNLVRSFPHAEAMIPELPRKSVVSRFRPEFLEARKRGLSHFLKYARTAFRDAHDGA